MSGKDRMSSKDRKFLPLFEESPLAMWVVDEQTKEILEANPAAVKLYDARADEFRRLSLEDPHGGWRHRTRDGRVIDAETGAHHIEFGGRQAQLVVLLDVTDRARLEEQLRQAQKMEAVGMLAGGVAHDFNNLLTIITGYSQLVLNNLPAADPNRHSIEQIIQAGDRAAALTQQLLAFSRRQVLQPKVLDLNRLVTSLSTMLRRLIGEDIDLRLALGADLGRVHADPGRIEQVLMNLTVNARDAMPKGGTLTLETANVFLDENYSSKHLTVKAGQYILLAVSDTGDGMDAGTQARMFEPFFTTKESSKGTGLGLSTVFGIVKQSGGSVQVYSEPGRGTSIKVYLPRIDQPVAIEPAGAPKVARRGTETLLLVEDDDMVRHLMRETLERAGYKVKDTADPIEAGRISDSHSGKIDLLITDVIMPKVSGTELAAMLIARRPEMKVLYISGYTDNAIVNSGLLHHEVAFLQKPFAPAALIEKVRDVLEGNGKRRRAGE
jgi:two-component system cell cycle sensor histidine kinase/response regulator CckA